MDERASSLIDPRRALSFIEPMAESLTVHLAERSYELHFGTDLTAQVRALVEQLTAAGGRVAVVTDEHLVAAQGAALTAMFGAAPRISLAPGEETKSLTELERVLEFLAEQQLDRGGTLFAVGGGVIGDLAGFAAASYLRGIAFYQVPTTLLAMVDSSVGGKTGVNLRAGKNLAGAFHQPAGVFIATDFLRTLPGREFAAGMAEVIKYGLLGDAGLLAQLERSPLTPESPELAATIRRCCALKAKIVEADERELAREGGRALLNLGHTFGHAIEQVTSYGTYLHGEAVAIGLCAAARLSQRLGYLTAAETARVEAVVAAHALPTRLRAALPLADLLAAMARDKKVRGGLPRLIVMKALGEAATQGGISPAFIEAVFREVGAG